LPTITYADLLCVGTSTFFEGIEEFPAGHFAIYLRQLGKVRSNGTDTGSYQPLNRNNSLKKSDRIIQSLFLDSVKLRLRSDVGIGILLSGGIDSSAIAAAVHHINPNSDNVVSFPQLTKNGYDEEPFIDAVAPIWAQRRQSRAELCPLSSI
jgi:asparagine synthase (glutamine-hydrolysing)